MTPEKQPSARVSIEAPARSEKLRRSSERRLSPFPPLVSTSMSQLLTAAEAPRRSSSPTLAAPADPHLDARRFSRSAAARISYKEPSLHTKVRKGHKFFKELQRKIDAIDGAGARV